MFHSLNIWMSVWGSDIWPDTVVGWLTSVSLLLGMFGLWIRQDRAKQKVMHDLNVVSHRAQETARQVDILKEKTRMLESMVERFETKVELILERLIESRQEADKRVLRYEDGMRNVTTRVEEVRDRLTRLETTVKHLKDADR